jgi:hypothetical protein
LLLRLRMISVVSSVVFSLYSLLHPVAFTARRAECRSLPPNIQVDRDLRPAVTRLLARSRTLRVQCLRIATSPSARVTVTMSIAPMGAGVRARSVARRYESGLLIVEVQIPPASREFAELLAHELEHVTELIDGAGVGALAAARTGTGRRKWADASFEDRARDAEILVAREVAEETDAPAAAVTRQLSGAWRMLARFARTALRR